MLSPMLRTTNAAAMALGALLLVGCAVEPAEGVAPELEADGVEPGAISIPPLTTCTSKTGCGAPIGTPIGPTTPICESGVNQCFGAVGIDCDGAVPNGLPVPQDGLVAQAGCSAGVCWINAGSWVHDQCCFGNTTGRWCGGIATSLSTSSCVAEMDRAVHRVAHRLGWKRAVNMCRVDSDGVVNFSEYCAPGGTVVASTDANRCCAGGARPLAATAADVSLVVSQGVVLDGTFTPFVCNGTFGSTAIPGAGGGGGGGTTPAPSPKPCITNAQCAADEMCAAPSSDPGATKTCWKL
jgi:hypothetical protein